jgi:hypothetical protein
LRFSKLRIIFSEWKDVWDAKAKRTTGKDARKRTE